MLEKVPFKLVFVELSDIDVFVVPFVVLLELVELVVSLVLLLEVELSVVLLLEVVLVVDVEFEVPLVLLL